ncbi:MAG: hypothetical protein IH851_11690 [Armatimonadetes bacterium]|nr:hypothetical protein [Armatimonadota bacterium]
MKRDRLTPELDELLWAAAETDDPEVWADFERRYPKMRASLATRRAMIEAFRKARPRAVEALRDRYNPPQRAPVSPWRRLAVVPLAGLLLVGLAFGAYVITERLTAPKQEPENSAGPGPGPDQMEPPTVVPDGPPIQFAPDSTRGIQPDTGEPSLPPGTAPRPTYINPGSISIDLPATGTTLLQALELIANQGRVSITVMPGVQDVPLDFGAANPDAILTLPADEMLLLIERVAPIRLLDNGPEGYLVLPIDRVTNVEPPAGSEAEPAEGGPAAVDPNGP